MNDRVKDYVWRTRMDTRQALKDHEDFLKKRNSLTERYNKMSQSMTTGTTVKGRRGTSRSFEGSVSGRSRETLDVRMGDTLSRLRGVRGGAKDTTAIDRLLQKTAQLRRELAKVKSSKALTELRLAYGRVNREAEQLIRAQKKFNAELSLSQKLGQKFNQTLSRSVVQLGSVYALSSAGQGLFHIGKDLDSLRAALLGASSGSEEASANLEHLKQVSMTYGKDVTTLVRGFNKIGAGARAMNMDMEEANKIFLAATQASTAYGLNTQRTELVMMAFGQMMSKNRVSMEELNCKAPSLEIAC